MTIDEGDMDINERVFLFYVYRPNESEKNEMKAKIPFTIKSLE
jgi:hypothetical protein